LASDRRCQLAGAGARRVVALVAGVALAVGAGACVAPPGHSAAVVTAPAAPPDDPRAATVRIRSETCDGIGVGSGFLLDAHTIITNRHVVEGATKLSVETYEGDHLSVDVASQGRVADLAILKIKKGIGQAARLATDDPAAGSHIRAFGYSGGGPMRVTGGTVKGYTADWELGNKGQVIQATVEIRPGNSGGPALDDADRVVGVVYAIELQTKLALIVPLSTLTGVLHDPGLLRPVKAC